MYKPALLLVTLALSGCRFAPSHEPVTNEDLATTFARLAEARATQAAQIGILTAALADRAATPFAGDFEPAGTIELNARLANLSRQLDELLLRVPAGERGATATEATARRAAAASSDEPGIAVLQQALEVNEQMRLAILENLANVPTPGFKKRQVNMSTSLHPATGLQLPVAARIGSVFTAGALEITERALDVAIDGDGFFVVALPDGRLGYTRDGCFHVDADGKLVSAAGCVVQPETTIPSDALEVSIDPQGVVAGRTAGAPDRSTRFGAIELARFMDPSTLVAAGHGAMRASETTGNPVTGQPGAQGLGVLKQGFVERSNVQVVHELVNLQLVQRQRTVLLRALAEQGVFVR